MCIDKQKKRRQAFDINVRAVFASTTTGRKGLQKICVTLDLPKPITSKPHNALMKHLSDKYIEQADIVMKKSALKLSKIILDDHPEKIEINNDKLISSVAVTVDGTWHRRGHCSKIGVVFVISVLTGEVLDYLVKSLYCHECLFHQKDKESDEYKQRYDSHKDQCCINHVGSSDAMETQGAKEIFLRSIEKYGLKYVEFVGDGDSGCFGAVREVCEKEYGGEYVVRKEECVGHVQKRMGTGLPEYKRKNRGRKLRDGKTVGGSNRLTDKVIDKMQNFYGQAIRNNCGDLD